MNYFNEDTYTEQNWRDDADVRERDEIRREASDQADWYNAGASPALIAFLNETTPDAPGGRYIMQGESDLDQATRQVGDMRVDFGMELSTSSMLRARFGKKVA